MHWKFKVKPDTDNNFGFVYIITNKKTKKAYIGCNNIGIILKVRTSVNQTGRCTWVQVNTFWKTYKKLVKEISSLK